MKKEEALQIHPVALAFLGDAVYSLYVREQLIKNGEDKPAIYQKAAARAVSARGQNELLQKTERLFTEEEADIFRRARNARKGSKSRSASVAEYNRSTGIEAVIGYLYLTNRYDRIEQLLGYVAVEPEKEREILAECKELKP
ncbi:MAG: ribonuclease III domain-containing protein [Candidatus Borkfalkiaceae bacterium]|nr:ribonuclease III domain-containing protein [Clostridia bacterium]MDY6223765.1 ribonuclease III domain-containing protein [Christensenellaceae bacterium]